MQVALERTAQTERPSRPIKVALELALIGAIKVLHLAVETPQGHLRGLFQRIQSQPGEVQPVDGRHRAQALLPVGAGRQFKVLIRAGRKVQGAQLGTLGVDVAQQAQRHRPLFRRQAG
ncbi:hypothetical protein D3C76_1316130 [compost metagenome]